MSINKAGATDAMFASLQSGQFDSDQLSALDGYENDRLDEGLDLQLAVLDRYRAIGQSVGGWKIGMTSRAGRDGMGKGYRPFGFVLADRAFSSGVQIERSRIGACSVEPEIGVTIGTALSGHDVTAEQAKAAVQSVSPAFEICEQRLPADMNFAVRIGDNLNQWGIVFGPGQSTDTPLDNLTIELYRDGELIDSGSSEPALLDSPYLSLARLCDRLAYHDLGLEPGQRIITGSITAGHAAIGTGQWSAKFGALGEVAATFI